MVGRRKKYLYGYFTLGQRQPSASQAKPRLVFSTESSIVRKMSNYRAADTLRLADAFKALSNPHRLKIFQQLMSCCELGTVCTSAEVTKHCVGELGNGLQIAPSTLSHHIKELSRAGLIRMERRGQHVDCWVEPATVNALSEFFQGGN